MLLAPHQLTRPASDVCEPSDATVELSLEPAVESSRTTQLLRRVVNLLARTPLEVTPRPSGVILQGDMSAIMDAVEQVHRMANRVSTQIVTTVRVIEPPDSDR